MSIVCCFELRRRTTRLSERREKRVHLTNSFRSFLLVRGEKCVTVVRRDSVSLRSRRRAAATLPSILSFDFEVFPSFRSSRSTRVLDYGSSFE